MKFLVVLFVLFIAQLSYADAWDNLTMEEAKAVVAELEKNPFIFDYCDCCDDDGEYASNTLFVKVTSTEIVTCDWNREYYAIKYEYDIIAEISYSAAGLDIREFPEGGPYKGINTLYMNYTRGFNKKTKMASSFFNIVPYPYYEENPRSCKDDFAYPTPKELATVYRSKSYKKWWKRSLK